MIVSGLYGTDHFVTVCLISSYKEKNNYSWFMRLENESFTIFEVAYTRLSLKR